MLAIFLENWIGESELLLIRLIPTTIVPNQIYSFALAGSMSIEIIRIPRNTRADLDAKSRQRTGRIIASVGE